MPDSEAVTQGVRVQVRSQHVPEQSDPGRKHWFFAYRIRISNESERTVQLLSRHWIIVDATGHREEVRGEGVVGEQPRLRPGEAYEYTSFCPLPTPFGSMEGSYRMVDESGGTFDVHIAQFELSEELPIN